MTDTTPAQLNIGLIGAGLIGLRHLKVLQDDPSYRVAGIVDPSDAVKAMCVAEGLAHYTDVGELLAHASPDGVIVAVPNQMHVEVGSVCLNAGVPVLMEKPIADTPEGAVALVRLSEQTGIPLLVAHHRRHYDFMAKARELIETGTLGQVLAVNALWVGDKPSAYFDIAWHREPGAGPVLINAIHDIDNLRMLVGEVESVQAVTANTARGFAVEDAVAVTLRFESGALGTLLLSDAAPSTLRWECGVNENPAVAQGGRDCYSISGTKGTLFIPSMEMHLRAEGEHWHHAPIETQIEANQNDAYVAQMQNFADVIRGVAEPFVNAEEGMRTLLTTQAVLKAATSGGSVRIADEMTLISG